MEQNQSEMVKMHMNKEIIPKVKVCFDAAYDNRKSASGLVAWGPRDEFLASKVILHTNVPSPFAAEAYAGLEAVKLGRLMGLSEIHIKGDLRTIIEKCKKTKEND
ncbi:hypothetical protein J1N35_006659 [Gossypium stocksii]|uniref:RNase H type-1 domain-containing protein n=1 Tax=Gossypium stocksii TaxID=47602 RepID=A0A9D4AEU7_9ROSI|nr:hypothetical protein J1N35_006659 [Gossypium stocksii]